MATLVILTPFASPHIFGAFALVALVAAMSSVCTEHLVFQAFTGALSAHIVAGTAFGAATFVAFFAVAFTFLATAFTLMARSAAARSGCSMCGHRGVVRVRRSIPSWWNSHRRR